ncbi:hypothetical protein RRG08_059962, partial [Elysia crispata]
MPPAARLARHTFNTATLGRQHRSEVIRKRQYQDCLKRR